jgi:hypothetical protein
MMDLPHRLAYQDCLRSAKTRLDDCGTMAWLPDPYSGLEIKPLRIVCPGFGAARSVWKEVTRLGKRSFPDGC